MIGAGIILTLIGLLLYGFRQKNDYANNVFGETAGLLFTVVGIVFIIIGHFI